MTVIISRVKKIPPENDQTVMVNNNKQVNIIIVIIGNYCLKTNKPNINIVLVCF